LLRAMAGQRRGSTWGHSSGADEHHQARMRSSVHGWHETSNQPGENDGRRICVLRSSSAAHTSVHLRSGET
jgi:hypothetical protein